PASIGKAYLREMGIIPPMRKFNIPDYLHGIAAQAYFGGRAECRIRNTPVPVVLTDFSSQYPTVNSLLGNPGILTAENVLLEKAIRIVTHGQQKGLKPTNLRGMVEVDPRKHDLFRVMVEQKEVHKHNNKPLSYSLKITANSTSYGMFYELTPQQMRKPTKVRV